MCYLFYTPSTDKIIRSCDDQKSFTRLYLQSDILADNDIYHTDEGDEDNQLKVNIAESFFRISYWCLPNYCNNRTIAESIIKAVKDHYDLSSMYKVLKIQIEEVEEDYTTISQGKTTTIITTTLNKNPTKQNNNIATSIYISLIMTIFNVCFILFF